MRRSLGAELKDAFRGRRVLVTGHTGFKGGWLTIWLSSLGAEVTGLALPPEPGPGIFTDAAVGETCRSILGDVREPEQVRRAVEQCRPEVVFHLAAQALVRRSYEEPLGTFATNVMGTAHLLEAMRTAGRPCAVVVVTSDKCYENREWSYAYRENDPMGGHDPYSASKGAAELVTQSFRRSFFSPGSLERHGVALATARAGNVIGGGDWAQDRIVPDAIRALSAGSPVPVRNPRAIRPWQHVLEPLSGYLVLAAGLLGADGPARERLCDAWNFGPLPESAQPVEAMVRLLVEAWGSGSWVVTPQSQAPHEAGLLRLAIDKAVVALGWAPRWELRKAVEATASWYREHQRRPGAAELRALTERQIADYCAREG
jgi:CDP-glucose 4,6-dehydratase